MLFICPYNVSSSNCDDSEEFYFDDSHQAAEQEEDDFAYRGFALTHRPPRRLCFGSAASRPRLRLLKLYFDAPPALKAMPRLSGCASTTSSPQTSLRHAARLEGYASVERPQVHNFACTSFAQMHPLAWRLCLSEVALHLVLCLQE